MVLNVICSFRYQLIPFASRNPECRFLASSSKDGSVRIWDTVLGRCEKILTGHTQSVTCVKWGGDGLLYTSSQDRTVKVWRAKDVSVCEAVNDIFRQKENVKVWIVFNLIVCLWN